MYGVNKNYAT